MQLEYVPLLRTQRELYALPRGFERFREYLRTMTDAETGDLRLPLVAMNPMGKDHLPVFLDALLAFDADAVGARAVESVRAELRDDPGAFRVALCVSDDLKGGWTDRAASEFGQRFEQTPYAKRGWIAGILWTSERYDERRVQAETLASIHRAVYVQRHGPARTLAERLRQEGSVMSLSGAREPDLDHEELAYTREVLAPLLASTDWPTAIAALFGDPAAKKLGLRPLGLAERAGLRLAHSTGGSI